MLFVLHLLCFAPKLAIDDSNSNSKANTYIGLPIPVDLGDGTGNTTRNLCPRQHTYKLSDYYFEILFKYKQMLKPQIFIFIFFLRIYHFFVRIILLFSLFRLCLLFVSKQTKNRQWILLIQSRTEKEN